MPELDVEIDGDLLRRAVESVDGFVNVHRTPVSRSQIAGLLQIACNEPGLLSRYAGNQKERAQKREASVRNERKADFQDEIEFWKLVQGLCEGKGKGHAWSLLQAREAAEPAGLKLEKLAPGTALTKQDQERRKQTEADRRAWARRWDLDHYAAFFRHFCAHYLYRMPPPAGKH
jgi:hypothetical protein